MELKKMFKVSANEHEIKTQTLFERNKFITDTIKCNASRVRVVYQINFM